ncbi:MAG: WG repeat-containing protein [Crocinitomicaceae bacterium]|nr:WG repeat-containing protein [Crocinitomicaceae bacterium]MBK8926157.1 WG repeat-containing protein [Crocinitomicaceae bacterium]
MKILFLVSVLSAFNGISQNWQYLTPKLDTLSGKYGFTDTTNSFVIKPTFDEVRNFVSEYTSVRVDTLWGVIDQTGSYIFTPNFSKLSVVYRDHFIEDGKNMKFRSIKGNILYEYLFIPGPFDEMKDFQNDPEFATMQDSQLIIRIMQMYEGHAPCHYYEMNRIFNHVAIGTSKYGKMTIDFVLDNPQKVITWIKNDKKYETDFANGKIDCCGHGPVWYGE